MIKNAKTANIPFLVRQERRKFSFFGVEGDEILAVVPLRYRRYGENLYALLFLVRRGDKLVLSTGRGRFLELGKDEAIRYLSYLLASGFSAGSVKLSVRQSGISHELGAVTDGNTIRKDRIELDAKEFPVLAKIVSNYDVAYAFAKFSFESLFTDADNEALEFLARRAVNAVMSSWPHTDKVPDVYWAGFAYAVSLLFAKPNYAVYHYLNKIGFFGTTLGKLMTVVDLPTTIEEMGALPRVFSYLEDIIVDHLEVMSGAREHMFIASPLAYFVREPYDIIGYSLVPYDDDEDSEAVSKVVNILRRTSMKTINHYIATSLLATIVSNYTVRGDKIYVNSEHVDNLQRLVLNMLGCNEKDGQLTCYVDKVVSNYKYALSKILNDKTLDSVLEASPSDLLYLLALKESGLLILTGTKVIIKREALRAIFHGVPLEEATHVSFDWKPFLFYLAGYCYGDEITVWKREVGDALVLRMKFGGKDFIVYYMKNKKAAYIVSRSLGETSFDDKQVIAGVIMKSLHSIEDDKSSEIKLRGNGDITVVIKGVSEDVVTTGGAQIAFDELALSDGIFELPPDIAAYLLDVLITGSKASAEALLNSRSINIITKTVGTVYVEKVVRVLIGSETKLPPSITFYISPPSWLPKFSKLSHKDTDELVEIIKKYIQHDISERFMLVRYENGRLYLYPKILAGETLLLAVSDILLLRHACSIEDGFLVCDANKISGHSPRAHPVEANEEMLYVLVAPAGDPPTTDIILRLYRAIINGGTVKITKEDLRKIYDAMTDGYLLLVNSLYGFGGDEKIKDELLKHIASLAFLTAICGKQQNC